MAQKYSLFAYKKGSSFLHKIPAWAKLLFIPLINILFLCLPYYFAIGLIVVQTVIAFSIHFTIKEQLSDLKPVIYYAFLLLTFKIFMILFSGALWTQTEGTDPSVKAMLLEEKETLFLLIRLFCVMQSASLVFKTSTSLELRAGIEVIELRIRKIFHLKPETVFTDAISMFLNFIPMVGANWELSKKAWLARGGKHSVKMYLVLLPVLFSVSMKKAWNTTRAVLVRK